MLGKVQLQAVAADAQVQRQISLETVLELDAEPQEIQIELARLGFVEHPQDWNGLVESRSRRGRGVCLGKHR
ncbi:hypothetical protein D3C87_1915240 [compost metagenome]